MHPLRPRVLTAIALVGGASTITAQPPARPIVQTIPANLPTLRLTPHTTIPEDVIGGTGIASFTISPDGHVAIDNGASQVRLVSPAGTLVRTIGRAGDGPGEFRGPLLLGWLTDTLVAIDGRLRRISFFRPSSGTLASTIPWGTEKLPTYLITSANRLYGISANRTGAKRERPNTPGLSFNVLMSAVVGVTATGVSAPIRFLTDSLNDGDGFDCEDQKGNIDITAFFPDHGPMVTVLPGPRLVTAVRDSFLLTIRGPASAVPVGLVREAVPRLKLSTSLWDSLTAPFRGPSGALRCGTEVRRPEYVPAIRAIQGDERGRLWIEVSRANGSEMLVVDPRGFGVGRFPMPPRDTAVPWQVRNGALYLGVSDADGLQGIRVFRVGLEPGNPSN